MTSANILAKNGLKVLLLEGHNKLGGLATWFFRKQKSHLFDVSLHGFPFAMKKTLRKYWNEELASHIVPLRQVSFRNPQFNLDTSFTRQDYEQKLQEVFDLPQTKVEEFFSRLMNPDLESLSSLTVKDLLEEYFPGRNDAHRFLVEPITYANGTQLDDPAQAYAIVFGNFLRKGVYTYRGSTDQMIKLLCEEMVRNGVDIKLNCPVDRIHVNEQGKISEVTGPRLKQAITCDQVISNAHLYNTVHDLVGTKYFSESYLQSFQKMRINSSSCQIYMGLKEGESFPFMGELIFTSTKDRFAPKDLLAFETTSRTYSLYYPEDRPGVDRYSIVCSTNALFNNWQELSKEEYEKAKSELIEESLQELEAIIPDIREKIEYVEAATPKTIKRYTQHPLGSSFGTKYEGLPLSQNLYEEIPGLYHAGSVGIIMSGWLGAANYAVIVCNELLRHRQLSDLPEKKLEIKEENTQNAYSIN